MGNKKVSQLAAKPSGLLRKRLRESVVRINQGEGLPKAEFKMKALDGQQFNLMLDEAASMTEGVIPMATSDQRAVRYSVVGVDNLYDEDGELVEVVPEEYEILGTKYTCLPDAILNMLPPSIIRLLASEAKTIMSYGREEKKDSNSTGGSESVESAVTPGAQPAPEGSEAATSADSEQ